MARKQATATSKQHRAKTVDAGSSTDCLALSDLRIRLDFLENDNEKLLKQIEKKRTELQNLHDRIREIGVEVAARSAPILQQLLELDTKVHETFAEIFAGRKFGKQSRQSIEKIYYTLQLTGLISPRQLDREDADDEIADDDEERDWNAEDFFGRDRQSQFGTEDTQPPIERLAVCDSKRDERQKIRQLFLKLADVFHPDKTFDDLDSEYRSEVMKEINQAYEAGDLAKLLAIEKQHQMGEVIDRNREGDLLQRCDRIERENEFLTSQLANLKQEIKEIKKTPQGSIVADYRKLTKSGFDPIGEIVAETETQVKIIAEVHQFAIDFRDRKMTIKDFLQGPAIFRQMQQVSPEEILMELLSQF